MFFRVAGRRDFGDFIAEYAGAVPGDFVDVESGEVLGTCANLAAVTHGQGAGISGLPERQISNPSPQRFECSVHHKSI